MDAHTHTGARRIGMVLVVMAVMGTGCASARVMGSVSSPSADLTVSSPLPSSMAPVRGDPVTIATSTRVAFEPAHVVVTTRVVRDERNRLLTIEWWTPEGIGGSHGISLEGGRAAIRHGHAIKGLGAGEYMVTAVLMRSDGTEIRRSTHVMVVGEGDPTPSRSNSD